MNIRQPQQTKRKIMSFTLIECLLVLWILTSLASLSVHGYQKMQQQLERARFFRQFESSFYLTIARAITTDAPSEMIINASGFVWSILSFPLLCFTIQRAFTVFPLLAIYVLVVRPVIMPQLAKSYLPMSMRGAR